MLGLGHLLYQNAPSIMCVYQHAQFASQEVAVSRLW